MYTIFEARNARKLSIPEPKGTQNLPVLPPSDAPAMSDEACKIMESMNTNNIDEVIYIKKKDIGEDQLFGLDFFSKIKAAVWHRKKNNTEEQRLEFRRKKDWQLAGWNALWRALFEWIKQHTGRL